MVSVSISVVLIALSSTSLGVLAPYSLILRVLAIAVLGVAFLHPRTGQLIPSVQARALVAGAVGFAVGNFWLLVSSTIPHGLASTLLFRLPAFLGFAVLVSLLLGWYSPQAILRGVAAGLTSVVVASLMFIPVYPAIAIEQGRARGLLENANTFGFVAALLIVVSVGAGMKRVSLTLSILVGFTALVLSASRGGLLFLGVALLGMAFCRVPSARGLLSLGGLTLVLLALAAPEALSTFELLRAEDTREAGWEIASEILRLSPTFGVGLERGMKFPVAGSWAGGIVWGGLVGIVGLVISAVALLRPRGERNGRAVALVAAALTYSLVESWMLSLSGTTSLLIFFVWIGVTGRVVSRGVDPRIGVQRRSGPSGRMGRGSPHGTNPSGLATGSKSLYPGLG